MGRTNRSSETRDRIVAAFMQCVIDLGLDKASMGEVGARLDLDRSSVHYYFRTREELIEVAVATATRAYVERMQQAVAGFSATDRPRQLVDYLFGSGFHRPDMSVLIDEFSVAGNRDPGIQECVAGLYRAVEDSIGVEIDREFPGAPRAVRRNVSYALSQLLEGCTVMKSLGFPASRWQAGRAAALQMLASLDNAGESSRPHRRAPSKPAGRRQ